jgi:hypothetical protein
VSDIASFNVRERHRGTVADSGRFPLWNGDLFVGNRVFVTRIGVIVMRRFLEMVKNFLEIFFR